MDGNIKDTPPSILVPKPEDRPQWEKVTKAAAELGRQAELRKQAARADFDKWLTSATPEQVLATLPADGLRLHAKLSEGEGKTVNLTVDGKPRALTLPAGLAWDAGHVAAKAFKSQPGGTLEVADAGDFEKDQGFSYGARGCASARPPPSARSSPGWTTSTTTAAGTCGCRTAGWGRTSSTSGPAMRSRSSRKSRSRPASGGTCSSPTTAPGGRPASRSTSTASRRRRSRKPTPSRAQSVPRCR